MKIKKTFLNLTKKTYPHGTERKLYGFLPKMETDIYGNKFLQIGNSSVMFASHLDTASSKESIVNHVIDYPFISTDGTTILGADDKAGVTIMLYMISKNVPGLYYFFVGEESGCIGSKSVSNEHKTNKLEHINKVISFDRRNYHSIITHQLGGRCCSDVFAESLSNALNEAGMKEKTITNWKLNYSKDSTGLYTDSAQFTRIYSECTNISVGYFSEHTGNERQNILHLEKLAKSCVLVDWENLPVVRDPSVIEYNYYGYGWDDYDDGYYTRRTVSSSTNQNFKGPVQLNNTQGQYYVPETEDEEIIVFYDKIYNYSSTMTIDKVTGSILKYSVSQDRIKMEEDNLRTILSELEIGFKSLNWNGTILKIQHSQNSQDYSETPRQDLFSYYPELEFWKNDKEVMEKLKKIKSDVEYSKEIIGIL